MIDFRVSGIIGGIAFFLSLLLGMFSRTRFPMLILRPLLFAIVFFVIAAIIKYLISRFLPELLEDRPREDLSLVPGSRIDITETGAAADALAFSRESQSPGGARVSPYINAAIPKPYGVGTGDSEESIGNVSDLLKRRAALKPLSSVKEEPDPGAQIAQDIVQDIVQETPEPNSGTEVQADQEAQTGMDQNSKVGYTEPGVMDEIPAWGLDQGKESPIKAPLEDFKPEPAAEAAAEAVAETPRFEPAPAPPRFAVKLGEETGEVSGGTDILPDLDSMAGAFRSASSDDEGDNQERNSLEYSLPASPARPASDRNQPQWKGDFNAEKMAKGLQTVLSKEKEG